jgi:HNH endonuclease/NUMOD4 motif
MQYRSVPGYEGCYEATDDGRIWSIPRGGRRGRFLKPSFLPGGYPFVVLSKNGITETLTVHVIVATAFHGKCPSGKQARHWDGNPVNNVPSNVFWGTPLENAQDRIRHGTQAYVQGDNHGKAILTEEIVRQLRAMHRVAKLNYKQLAPQLGISPNALSQAIRGLTWKHVI